MSDTFDVLIEKACELVVAKEAEAIDKILSEPPELGDVERSRAFFALIDAELQKPMEECDDARIRACSDVEAAVFEQNIPVVIDATGTPLCPEHPEFCLGSGDFPSFECCCDECDHYLNCYPQMRDYPEREKGEPNNAKD